MLSKRNQLSYTTLKCFCIVLVQYACHTFHLLDTCSSLGDKQEAVRSFGTNYLWG